MPKAKTNRGAAKRFKRTKNGGFKHSHGFTNHLRSAKSSKRRRNLRKQVMTDQRDLKSIKRLLPNG
ncbi:MAG: 50S ribosomal protein L35 [Candidatus Hydrogenedentota bacterium]